MSKESGERLERVDKDSGWKLKSSLLAKSDIMKEMMNLESVKQSIQNVIK